MLITLNFNFEGRSWDMVFTILHDENVIAALLNIVVDVVIIATHVLDLKLFAWRLGAVNANEKDIVTYTSE